MDRNIKQWIATVLSVWVAAGAGACVVDEPGDELGGATQSLGGEPTVTPPGEVVPPPGEPVGCCPGGGTWEYDAEDEVWVYRCDSGADLPAIWDLEAIRNSDDIAPEPPAPDSAAETREGRGDVEYVQVQSVYFTSWEWLPEVILADGTYPNSWESTPLLTGVDRHPIRIHGHLAVPRGEAYDHRRLPAVVIGHGIPGQADRSQAVRYARNLGLVALAIDGPGQGQSEGDGVCSEDDDESPGFCDTGSNRCSLFRGAHIDPRGSWLYGYAVAGMRAITYLGTLRRDDFASSIPLGEGPTIDAPVIDGPVDDFLDGPDPLVDTGRVAVIGASGGGLMALLANGIDERLAATVAAMASGALDEAGDSVGFVDMILGGCGLDETSPAVQQFLRYLDPVHYAPASCSPTYVATGLQDEIFTVNAAEATYAALLASGREVRWDILPNWDHGAAFTLIGPLCDAFNNACASLNRTEGDFGYWMRHHVLGTPEFGYLPEPPAFDGPPVQGIPSLTGARRVTFAVTIDPGDASVRARSVKLWISEDDGCTTTTRTGYAMRRANPAGTRYSATVILSTPVDELLYFADVEYELPSPVIANEVLDPTGHKCATPQTAQSMHLTTEPEFPGDDDSFRAATRVLDGLACECRAAEPADAP